MMKVLLTNNLYASERKEAINTTLKAILQVEEVRLVTRKYGDKAKQYVGPKTASAALFAYSILGQKRISTTRFKKFRYKYNDYVIRPQIDYNLSGEYTISVTLTFDF